MSENEINLLMGVMNEGFKRVEGSIHESRKERREQIATIHTRLNDHGERIKALEVHVESNGGGFFGTFKTPRWQATGLAAVLAAVAIGFAIVKTCNLL